MSTRGRFVGFAVCVGVLGVLLVALPAAGHVPAASSTPGSLTQAILAPSPSASPATNATGTMGTTAERGDAEEAAGSNAPTTDPQDADPASPQDADPASVATPSAAGESSAIPAPDFTQPGSPPEAPAPVVVAIGDSIMSGHGLDDPSQSWPELLANRNGWQLTDLADDGTGFVQPGDADDTFQTQADLAVQLDPSIVIISASNNDLGVDSGDLEDQTMTTIQSLRAALPNAQIIALSAFWGDESPPDELQEATDDIHSAADAIGATFVDIGQPLAGRPDLMQDDDVHPTAAGQELLAQSIESDIAAAFAGG